MAGELAVNLALMAALVQAGLGIGLAAIGALTARRVGSPKAYWIAAGFLLLAVQGVWFARAIWSHPFEAAADNLIPTWTGLLALAALYVAVYRRP